MAEVNEGSFGSDETLNYDSGLSGIWSDTSGYYEVVIHSVAGQSCEVPYALSIAETGWWLAP